MSNGKFELYRDKSSEFRFRLKAGNGEIIGVSEGYKTKSGASNGIASVKKNAPSDSSYTLFQGSDEKWYFHLKATNNEIILASEGYSSKQAAETGIRSVQNNAPDAAVDDQS